MNYQATCANVVKNRLLKQKSTFPGFPKRQSQSCYIGRAFWKESGSRHYTRGPVQARHPELYEYFEHIVLTTLHEISVDSSNRSPLFLAVPTRQNDAYSIEYTS